MGIEGPGEQHQALVAHPQAGGSGDAWAGGQLTAAARPGTVLSARQVDEAVEAGAGFLLALPNVACVGGSRLTPSDAVRNGDWARITRLAAEASRLGS